MGKHLARMNAAKRLVDSGEQSSDYKKHEYENTIKELMKGAFGSKDMNNYVNHFFIITPHKHMSKMNKCCQNCTDRLLQKGKTGIKITDVEYFMDQLKNLVSKHAANCKSSNIQVSKTSRSEEDQSDCFNTNINFLCADCKKGGAFPVQEIKDPRLTGDMNFLEFRCSSFNSDVSDSKKNNCKKNCC